MKNLSRLAAAVATLATVLFVNARAAEDGAYVDFGKLTAGPDSTFVEVNLQQGLIRFAAKIAATQEPEAAELLNNIQYVRVNVVGLDDSNRTTTLDRMQSVRAELEKKGWEPVVTARESKAQGGDDVAVFMKMKGDDTIEGIVVTVIEKTGKAVFVNVVGNIRAEQIARLGDKMNIEPLRNLKFERGHKQGEVKGS